MERASEISRGAIAHIYQTGDTSSSPIVQICELKPISAPKADPKAPPRFRLAISDGVHFQQAMLATQLNALVGAGKVALNCLVRLNDFICNTLANKRILIILTLEVVAQLPGKVGMPVGIDAAMAGGAAQPVTGTENVKPVVNTAVETKPAFAVKPAGQNGFGGGGGAAAWAATAPAPNAYGARGTAGIMTTMHSTPASMFRPIQSINPYQNGWTIRGRCTYKSDLRKFQNSRGDGQVISFELTDDSGSIRITGFTQMAPMIVEKVHLRRLYTVSRGSLKQANERFNRSTSSFEMTLDKNSLLEEVQDDGSCCQIKHNFTKIARLNEIEVKGKCDVVGIVTSIGPLGEVVIRSTGEPCHKRSIHITDDSNASVELTLWRTQAESFLTEADLERHPVILLSKASRGDFGGVSLNVSRETALELDPVNIPEANKLRAWYDSGGYNNAAVQSLTSGPGGAGAKITGPRKSLEVAKVEDVDPVFSGGKSSAGGMVTFVTRAYVGFVNTKNDLYYPGDPETKKKLSPNGPGMWMSESTGQQLTDDDVVWRYIISMKVMDHSSSVWMSGFDEIGQALFGRTASDFRALKERDEALADHIIEDATFRPMLLKVNVKERVWKDEQQIRYVASRAEMIGFAAEGHLLLKEIADFGVM